MTSRRLLTWLLAAVAVLAWTSSAPAAEGAAKDGGICGECHEQAKTFSATPHGRAGKPGEAACVPCHGENAMKHAEAGGDKSLIQLPAGREGAETCLSCHDKSTEHKSFRDGVHQGTGPVNCLTCHAVHKAVGGVPGLLVKKDPKLCASCHPGPVSSFTSKPYAHKLGRGGMQCSSCHEPHGRHGKESLKETKAGEIACLACHTAQRGPFVFSHVDGAAGDCTSCHEPHGSANPKQLKRATVDGLCMECHTILPGGNWGSRPPATHNLNFPRWRNCTTCHVAVHGSNRSPKLLK